MSSKAPDWLSQIDTESRLALLTTRQANEPEGQGAEARKRLFLGPSWSRSWQASALKEPSCWGLVSRFFYGSEMGGRRGNKVKRLLNPAKVPWNGKPQAGDVLVSLPHSPPAGALTQVFSLSRPLCTPTITRAAR